MFPDRKDRFTLSNIPRQDGDGRHGARIVLPKRKANIDFIGVNKESSDYRADRRPDHLLHNRMATSNISIIKKMTQSGQYRMSVTGQSHYYTCATCVEMKQTKTASNRV